MSPRGRRRGHDRLIGTVLAAQLVHVGSMYVPGLRDVLAVEPVSFTTWLQLLPIASCAASTTSPNGSR